jgi:hypothetical protein
MQKQAFSAKKCGYQLKKPVNLPGIVILLSNMGKYAKINNRVVLEAFFSWKNCARR